MKSLIELQQKALAVWILGFATGVSDGVTERILLDGFTPLA